MRLFVARNRRRDFVRIGTAAGLTGTVPGALLAREPDSSSSTLNAMTSPEAPTVFVRPLVRPTR